jgi:hypothetical protein
MIVKVEDLKGGLEMKLPGFTADASLYKTGEHYKLEGAGADATGAQAVIPQICFTVPVCIPVIHKKVRVCCGFTGCSWSFVAC